jgi:riboflavin kinase/FMN adenylyltransferase
VCSSDLAQLLPPDGVYLARAGIAGGAPRPAIINLGTSPTFGPGARRLEVHVLGFSGNLYGRQVRVFFERLLRPELRFPSSEALARQIRLDIARAERHFRGRR